MALGEPVDIAEYAVLAGVVNRLGQRLGLSRHSRPMRGVLDIVRSADQDEREARP